MFFKEKFPKDDDFLKKIKPPVLRNEDLFKKKKNEPEFKCYNRNIDKDVRKISKKNNKIKEPFIRNQKGPSLVPWYQNRTNMVYFSISLIGVVFILLILQFVNKINNI